MNSLIKKIVFHSIIFICLLINSGALHAQALQNIIQRGMLHIGVVSGAPPMGMIDETGNPIGYDIDVANLLGKYMNVPVKIIPLTPPARIPSLLTGRVDFLVATLAPSGERARTVMFTQPYNAFQIEIVSTDHQKIKDLNALKGKRVATNRGSTQEAALRNAQIDTMKIVLYEDDSTSAQALFSGQVDAIALPSTGREILNKQRPDLALHSFVFYEQGNSMATRMGEFDVLQWLNTAIYLMKTSGELDLIAKKWTGRPMPSVPHL